MIQIRYPNITGKTPEERQSQMERYMRGMIDQLNFALQKENKTDETSTKTNSSNGTVNVQSIVNEKLKKYWETIYPVGHIYISASETDPGTLFGGTWEQIKDTFLLASGNTYAAGATGGEATHTLSTDEMPSHNHSKSDGGTLALNGIDGKVARGLVAKGTNYAVFTATSQDGLAYGGYVTRTGGGAAHNNMPPYLAVYVWKRIS